MSTKPRAALESLLQQELDRPLAALRIPSNQVMSRVSHGLQFAADNLLNKALRALRAGDPQKAQGYVERAVKLPFDEHEGTDPAWWAASMMVFSLVTDALEGCSPDDSSWLDAAEALLHHDDGAGSLALRRALAVAAQDSQLTHRETKRCRAAGGDPDPEAWDDAQPVEVSDRVGAILDVLRTVSLYEAITLRP